MTARGRHLPHARWQTSAQSRSGMLTSESARSRAERRERALEPRPVVRGLDREALVDEERGQEVRAQLAVVDDQDPAAGVLPRRSDHRCGWCCPRAGAAASASASILSSARLQ